MTAKYTVSLQLQLHRQLCVSWSPLSTCLCTTRYTNCMLFVICFSLHVFCTSVDNFRGRLSNDRAVEELLKKALNEVEQVMECVGEGVGICGCLYVWAST